MDILRHSIIERRPRGPMQAWKNGEKYLEQRSFFLAPESRVHSWSPQWTRRPSLASAKTEAKFYKVNRVQKLTGNHKNQRQLFCAAYRSRRKLDAKNHLDGWKAVRLASEASWIKWWKVVQRKSLWYHRVKRHEWQKIHDFCGHRGRKDSIGSRIRWWKC